MKTNKVEDERIIFERRRIQSRAYAGVVYVLILSILVQQFFLNAPFSQYAVEFFVVIGCGLYNLISNYKKGIDISSSIRMPKKKILLNTVAAGIASVIIFGILTGEWTKENLVSYFVVFVVFAFSFRLIIEYANNKKQKAIEKELDDEELL